MTRFNQFVQVRRADLPLPAAKDHRSVAVDADADMESDELSVGRVARGGATAFVIYGFGIGLTYFSQLIIARSIGIEAFGVYSYVLAWVVVLAYLAALGFDVGLLRFLPNYQTLPAWDLMKGVLQYAQRRVVAAGIILGLLGTLVVLASGVAGDVKITFLLGFALIPILALLRIRCSAIRAFGGVTWALAPDRIVREGVLISFVVIACFIMGAVIGAPAVMLAMLAGTTIGLICSEFALRRQLPPTLKGDVTPRYDAETWRTVALPLLVIGATEVLMNRTGIILLGWLVDTRSAGIYSLAFNIAMVVTLPKLALNTLFAPAISQHFARQDKQMMQKLVTSTALLTLVAATAIGGVFFVYADFLLGWFGKGYQEGVSGLRVLLVGQVIAASAGSQLYVMTMSGHERKAAWMLVVCASFNAILTALLIQNVGLTGAAIASASTLIVWNIAMGLFLWKRLGLKPGTVAAVTDPFSERLRTSRIGHRMRVLFRSAR